MTSTQQTAALFKPIKVGRLTLQHRVVLAPLTRLRAYASHVPGPQQASYYSQRGSTPGTLLITEATFISHDAGGYAHVPGIYTDAQIQGWKEVRALLWSVPNPSHGVFMIASGHGRRPCRGIVHLPPTLGTWSNCRHRCTREAGPTFTVRLRIVRRVDWPVEGTSSIDRGRDSRLHCRVRKSGKQRCTSCWIRRSGDTQRKRLSPRSVPSNSVQQAHG